MHVSLHVAKDEGELYVDLAGEPLHRRGYRTEAREAPIKETLAAAMERISGDEFDLGNGKKLVFVEAPMLHWPDSMFSYMTGDAVLFSNDAFGQHLATERLYNDLVDQDELYDECVKYYANILTPFSALVKAKIEQVLSLKLPVNMIATSHGVIWRKDPTQIVLKYMEWCQDYKEDRITILYDTMWEGTRALADEMARAIQEASPSTTVVSHCLSKFDKNDALTDVVSFLCQRMMADLFAAVVTFY